MPQINFGPIIGQIDIDNGKAIILASFDEAGTVKYRINPNSNLFEPFDITVTIPKANKPIRIIAEGLNFSDNFYNVDLVQTDDTVTSNIATIKVTTAHKMAFVSCNNAELAGGSDLWASIKADTDVDLIVMLGDNVYADGIFYQTMNELIATPKKNWKDVKTLALEKYRDLYYANWFNNDTSMGSLLSRVSTVAVPDNHDIYSAWGNGKNVSDYPKDVFSKAVKIGKSALNNYQRNLLFYESFPSQSNYYFNFKWGNVGLFCAEFRNGHSVETTTNQRKAIVDFANAQKLLDTTNIVIASPIFPLPRKTNGILSKFMKLIDSDINESEIGGTACAEFLDAVFSAKEIIDNVALICGDTHTMISGSIIQNSDASVPVYVSSPITNNPVTLTYPIMSSDDITAPIGLTSSIGASTDNSYLFDGEYRPAVRNYCTCYENNVGTMEIEHVLDDAPDNHLTLNTSNYCKYLAHLGNINVGTLSSPLDGSDAQSAFMTGQAVTTLVMLEQLVDALTLLSNNLSGNLVGTLLGNIVNGS